MFIMRRSLFYLTCIFSAVVTVSAYAGSNTNYMTGRPGGIPSYLFKSVSEKKLVETARDHQWSINFQKRNRNDTLHVIAIRIEFNNGDPDSSVLTTGNGLFQIRRGGDKTESDYYYKKDTVIYKYDNFPHDSGYFATQLQTVRQYFKKVSRGHLELEFSLYPSKEEPNGYAVPKPMTFYSPGAKKKSETWDDYYARKTKGLMSFIQDAIKYAAEDQQDSPFAGLKFNKSDSTILDEHNHKTVFLIIHAGSSIITDGLETGNPNTPSDMIDVFVNKELFHYYKDSLKLSGDGVTVQGKDPLFISEVMMCSETSNQDGLNWGIQGILVNQIARQLGIPDLSYSVSGVGAFCIMDFAGYSAGKGFIPPYPSAWVRAFMGWDDVKIASLGLKQTYHVKALTSVIDRDSSSAKNDNDTTILLVPINDHEYYLIENRQRNLAGNDSLFRYDSTDYGRLISSYPYNVNIDSNVVATSGESNVISKVRNNDISLPASGMIVWHVDEKVIRERLSNNMVNADSSYRGVSLVEADGITDLGVTFVDAFYQAVYDYGGAEDVFPHETSIDKAAPVTTNGFGPFTAPSSRANDGGHTYLELKIDPVSGSNTRKEYTLLQRGSHEHKVADFSDSLFSVSVSWNYLSQSWPKRAAPGEFFDPLLVDLDKAQKGKELFVLSKDGRAYAWTSDTNKTNIYNQKPVVLDRFDMNRDTVKNADTVLCLDSLSGVCAMPSAAGGRVFIPSTRKCIYTLSSLSEGKPAVFDTIGLLYTPATYICGYHDSSWALGCEKGRVVFGKGKDTISSLKLHSDSSVCAVAAFREFSKTVVVIQNDGTLSLCTAGESKPDTSTKVSGIGPYTLVTGDLDRDSSSEIVVCDSRHGVWVYKQNMNLAPGWEKKPSDWPSVYTMTQGKVDETDRSHLAVNTAPAALADIDRDGYLDILVGGTNGLYAFNYKGVLKAGWPSYLDKRYWVQRGSVITSPVVATSKDRDPLVLFSSSTGEKLTFTLAHVTSADRKKGMVWYRMDDGKVDSMWNFTGPQIDTILKLNDSLVEPYVLPGGFVDAVNASGKRPLITSQKVPQSAWPLTTGLPLSTAPLIGYMDEDNRPDLIAVSTNGWVYRWNPGSQLLPDTIFWPQTGYDNERTFAYGGGNLLPLVTEKEPLSFYSYPNPTNGSRQVAFRYKYSAPAKNVRLDIFSSTGFVVYSKTTMGNPPNDLTGSCPDWNEHIIQLDKFGSGVYRCRLEATVGSKKYVKYWKLAVVK
jgi:M6 family metalloprotease-like protein